MEFPFSVFSSIVLCLFFTFFSRALAAVVFPSINIKLTSTTQSLKKQTNTKQSKSHRQLHILYANRSLYFYFISKIFRVYALLIGVKKVSVNFSFTGRQFILYVSTSNEKSSRVIHTDGSEISRNSVLGSNRFQCCCWGNADLLKDMHITHPCSRSIYVFVHFFF
jgi:hypothetical protein